MSPKRDPFRVWLNRKYDEWEAPAGTRKSVRLWAEALGLNRDALSHWMHGIRRPDRASASLLASALGPEVYELLDMPRADPLLETIIQHWSDLDSTGLREIQTTLNRWSARRN